MVKSHLVDREQKAPTCSVERDDENRGQREDGILPYHQDSNDYSDETKAKRSERKRHDDDMSTSL